MLFDGDQDEIDQQFPRWNTRPRPEAPPKPDAEDQGLGATDFRRKICE